MHSQTIYSHTQPSTSRQPASTIAHICGRIVLVGTVIAAIFIQHLCHKNDYNGYSICWRTKIQEGTYIIRDCPTVQMPTNDQLSQLSNHEVDQYINNLAPVVNSLLVVHDEEKIMAYFAYRRKETLRWYMLKANTLHRANKLNLLPHTTFVASNSNI